MLLLEPVPFPAHCRGLRQSDGQTAIHRPSGLNCFILKPGCVAMQCTIVFQCAYGLEPYAFRVSAMDVQPGAWGDNWIDLSEDDFEFALEPEQMIRQAVIERLPVVVS